MKTVGTAHPCILPNGVNRIYSFKSPFIISAITRVHEGQGYNHKDIKEIEFHLYSLLSSDTNSSLVTNSFLALIA